MNEAKQPRIVAVIYGSTRFGQAHFQHINLQLQNLEQVDRIAEVVICLKRTSMDINIGPESYQQTTFPVNVEPFLDSMDFFRGLAKKYSADAIVKIHQPLGQLQPEVLRGAIEKFFLKHPAVLQCSPLEYSQSVIDIFNPFDDILQYLDYRNHIHASSLAIFNPETGLDEKTKTVIINRLKEYPRIIALELSQTCNLRCKKCNVWKNKPENPFIKETIIQNLLAELHDWHNVPLHFDLTGRGESLTYKNFAGLLYKLHQVGNTSIAFNTNGLLLDQQIIQAAIDTETTISISLDAASEEIYNTLQCAGDYEKVVNNIEYYVSEVEKQGKRNMLGLSFVVSTENEQEQEQYLRKWENRVSFIRFQALRKNNVQQTFETIHLADIPCDFPQKALFIKADGRVLFCFGHNHSCGNLQGTRLYDIWHGEKRKKYYERFSLSMNNQDDYCNNCFSRFCYSSGKGLGQVKSWEKINPILHTFEYHS